jgi:hypothetical protein
VSGAWVFKGTRLPVATVIENVDDLSIDEAIEQFDVPGQSRRFPCSVPIRVFRSTERGGARTALDVVHARV